VIFTGGDGGEKCLCAGLRSQDNDICAFKTLVKRIYFDAPALPVLITRN
jgi:hypothetical protein